MGVCKAGPAASKREKRTPTVGKWGSLFGKRKGLGWRGMDLRLSMVQALLANFGLQQLQRLVFIMLYQLLPCERKSHLLTTWFHLEALAARHTWC